MKKLSVFLALVLLLTINVSAEEYIFNEDFQTQSKNFTEDIADDAHFVKYDAENADIYAKNSDGQGGQTGVITLDDAINGDIDISFDFCASDKHQRLKMLFLNDEGKQIHTHQIWRNARTGVYLVDSGVKMIDDSFPRAAVGQRVYVQMKLDTKNETADYKVGLDGEGGIVWTDWATGKPMETTDGARLNLKSIELSNEYKECDVHIDNLSVGGTVDEGDDGKTPEDEERMEYIIPDEEGYILAYKNDFRTDTGVETTGTNTNEVHYAKLNFEKHRAETFNSDGVGSCMVKLAMPEVYKKDGTRAGFTFYSGETHSRMKATFYDASGIQMHQNWLSMKSGIVTICDPSASMIDIKLPTIAPLTAGRLELEFDFTGKTISYRVGHNEGDKWVYSAWQSGKQFHSAADAELSLAQIVFSNEYAVCDMFIDDVYVMVPEAKPEASNLAIGGMKLDRPISKDVFVAEYEYYEENSVAEAESIITWYASDTEDFKASSVVGSGKSFKVGAENAGKYIRFTVKPVGVNGRVGKEYTSSSVGPVELIAGGENPPVVTDVKVSGMLFVGAKVKAEYNFYDEDYDNETDTLIEWFVGDKLIKSGNGSDAAVCEILKEHEGKALKVRITPHSDGETAQIGESVEYNVGEITESSAYYDYMSLSTNPSGGSNVTGDIYLPIKGQNGSAIVWSSSNPSVIAADGTVRRASSDTAVTLTAQISCDGISYTKEFKYTVAKQTVTSGGGSGGGGGNGGGSSYVISGESVKSTPSLIVGVTKPTAFNDLEGYSWAEKEITELYDKGVISGDGDGCFHPERNISRAEFIQMVVKYFGISGSAELAFSDVSEQDWYYSCIGAAVSAGVVNGMSEDYFGAAEELTREDMAVILCRAKKFSAQAEYTELFADDENISGYARDSVYTLKELGIISGMDQGRFEPKGCARRAEAARIICVSGK